MPNFAYKAVDSTGHVASGMLTADTPSSGRDVLRQQGLRLVEFTQTRTRSSRARALVLGKAKRQEQVADFARELSMLLRAGVTLAESLEVLIEQRPVKLASVLRTIREKVSSGTTFEEALREHPSWFDAVFCAAVKVGESAGTMEESLGQLAVFIRDRQTVRTRLTAALAYPMILSVLGLAVVLFLMSYVIPQLLTVLETSGGSLPLTTVLLKGISDFLVNHWMILAASGAITVTAVSALLRWPPGRLFFQTSILKAPVLGTLLAKSIVAQFAQMIALLLKSGITFLEAIQLSKATSTNLVLHAELSQMESAVRRGSDIATPLRGSRIFPPLVAHIVHVGQNTGELPAMFDQLREGYATEVRIAVGRATAILEPVLIVILSAVVGFIVFATMMPILEATRAMQ